MARRILLALFATALLGAGLYLLSMCLERPSLYGMLRGGGVAAILIGLGAYLIWDDLLKPRLRRPRR